MLGAGAAFGLLAHAPRPRAATARAAMAAIVANFILIVRLLSRQVAAANLLHLIRVTILFVTFFF